METKVEDILNFWFMEIGPDRWFTPDEALDHRLQREYSEIYQKAFSGELKKWEETPESMLALVILLDQFPRRMFRGTPKAFEADELALDLARTAIIRHFDDRIDRVYKRVFYLPFEHSEHIGDQRLAIFYIRERTKEPVWVDEAERNLNVIQHFGRFPDRNELLGRNSTPEEIDFLQSQAANMVNC